MSNVLRVRSEPGGEWTEIPSIQGPQGEDGFSPTVTTSAIDGGTRVTITDATGDHSFDVMNGTGGADICPMVIAQLFLPSDENTDIGGTSLITKGSIVGAMPEVNQQGIAIIHQDGHLYYNRFKVTGPFNESGIADIEFISNKIQIDNANELITIKDTEVTNISQLPESSCCVHAINSEIGFTFKDDIIYIANLGSLVTIYTLNGDMITLIADSTGNLSVDSSGIDSWAKASEVYNKSQVDEKIAAIPSGGGTAADISYDDTTAGLGAANVQEAIEALAQDDIGSEQVQEMIDENKVSIFNSPLIYRNITEDNQATFSIWSLPTSANDSLDKKIEDLMTIGATVNRSSTPFNISMQKINKYLPWVNYSSTNSYLITVDNNGDIIETKKNNYIAGITVPSNTVIVKFGYDTFVISPLVNNYAPGIDRFFQKNIVYNNATSGLNATTLSSAIDELAARPVGVDETTVDQKIADAIAAITDFTEVSF